MRSTEMKRERKKRMLALVLVLSVCLSGSVFAQFTPYEIEKRDDWVNYLKTARIIDRQQLSVQQGITRPWVLTLQKNGIVRKAIWKPIEGLHKGYCENWRWEIAAYRLDKYLGLNMIPPTVERRFKEIRGSLQLWVDSRMSLREKNSKDYTVPQNDVQSWNRMMSLQRAFDNLIANEDRHQGNFLITPDWRIILIDHSRSFRTSDQFIENLIFTENMRDGNLMMRQLPRTFVERIKTLDFEAIKEVAGSFLTDGEIQAVLKRRDLMLDEIDGIIGVYGLEEYLY
jgi:hypothetical protein